MVITSEAGEPNHARPSARLRTRLMCGLAIGLGLLIVLFDILDGVLYLGDIDDLQRALQIHQLLKGQSWYDLSLQMIQMPEAYVSPWSRLVDLPYLVIALVLRPFVGGDEALQVAFHVWPPILLCCYCVMMVHVMAAILGEGRPLKAPHLVVAMVLMTVGLWEFSPGRIDHHNVQLVLLMLTFMGLLKWNAQGAIMVGTGCVLSVAVGLETLPIVALILVAVSLAWIMGRSEAGRFFALLGLVVLIGTVVFGVALIGVREMATTHCDSFSAPYISALAGYGIIACVMGITVHGSWIRRAIALGLPALFLIGGLAVAFPTCLGGPYQMVDPISRALWLERVGQEHSILWFFQHGNFANILQLAVMAVVLAGAAPVVLTAAKRGRTGLFIVFGATAALLLLTFVQTRFIRFPIALAPLFLPLIFVALESAERAGRWLLGGGTVVAAATILALHALFPVKAQDFDDVDYLTFDACKTPDLAALSQVEPGRIMVPASLGVYVADRLPEGMSIGAIPFHRASPGIRRMFNAFLSRDSKTRREAVAQFDYVAVCRLPLPEGVADGSLYGALARGKNWPGLTPVATGKPAQFQLFRIDHAAFR